ncbi:pimeloyl-CoA biosynthesis protein BioC [Serratia fonticola]|uniref:Malonyl-[acyl-carrier protein] O-methyltransferase n=1 Tax=Serratia fonticola TaxID=47917 RepID=A0A542BLV0_SERFO|nr:malonyl-ACP O-methyltransferase BioC [Serratia fonticola]TQI79543.1 pimeloyl-CoA biosynthesis protein BioC [Serratia fonticola]TQI98432.1 pimeloyl-CoA biosynthesis protein BioC [Serratia fonticola]TVZ67960.1 pimeloyl-CoA biosynthesis protein BioC [Serratia fonticola]
MTSAFDAVNKQAVASAFSRAAASYDAAALLQREVGERLLGMGENHPGEVLLDAGCGTGYFSRRWRERGKKVTALDLAPGMLAFARQQQAADHYLLGDIEHIPLPSGSVDICFSSLVVQWCSDLPRALAELYRVTRPGGLILFSTLAQGALYELGDAWQQVDGERHINNFLPPAQIADICQPYRHQLEAIWQTLDYPDVMTLMRSLKGIGATHLHQGREAGLLSRQRLNALQAAYPCRNGRFPLSYHLVYGVIYRD